MSDHKSTVQTEICVRSNNGKNISLTQQLPQYCAIMEDCIHLINSIKWTELLENIKNILENKENKNNKIIHILQQITPVIEAYLQYMQLASQFIAVYYKRCDFSAINIVDIQRLFSPFSFRLSQSLRNANFDFFVKQVEKLIDDSKFESQQISSILSTMFKLNGNLVNFNVRILQFRAEICELMIGQMNEPSEQVWVAFTKCTTELKNDTTEVNEFKNSVLSDPVCESAQSTPVRQPKPSCCKNENCSSRSVPSSPKREMRPENRWVEIPKYEMFGSKLPNTPTKQESMDLTGFTPVTYAKLANRQPRVATPVVAKPEPSVQPATTSKPVSNCCALCENDGWFVHKNGTQFWAPAYLDVRGCPENEGTKNFSQCIHNYFNYVMKNNSHVTKCAECKAFAKTYTTTFPNGNPCRGQDCLFLHMFDKEKKICLDDHHRFVGIFVTYLKQINQNR